MHFINTLKRLPIEVSIFFVLPGIAWIIFYLLNTQTWTFIRQSDMTIMANYSLWTNNFFILLIPFLITYICLKVWLTAARRMKVGFVVQHTKQNHKSIKLSTYLTSTIFILGGISFSAFSLSFFTIQLGWEAKTQVATTSLLLRSWDEVIFGTFVPLWIQWLSAVPFIDYILVFVYKNINFVIAGAFILFLANSVSVLRRFIVAFLLVQTLSFPFWYLVPAVSPDEMFRQNLFPIVDAPLSTMTDQNISPTVIAYADSLRGRWSLPDIGYAASSTFPSMHVAWGIIIAYFCAKLWKPLYIILIPWAILNTLSAVYTLQHYMVDVIGGIFTAIVGILLANLLINKSPYNDYCFAILELIQKDCNAIYGIVTMRKQGWKIDGPE